jgi:hypothetical protein
VSEFHSEVDTDADAFSEITTQKNKRVVEPAPRLSSFTDVTTKKGKSLRDLEADPLLAISVAHVEDRKTPSPVQPPSHLAGNRGEVVPVRPTLGEPPTLPNPPSLAPEGLQSGPSVTFESGPGSAVDPASAASGFSEVVAAMAAVASPDAATPATVVPVVSASPMELSAAFALKKSRLADLLQARSGLKYLVAVVILVALVILLVVVGLRGDAAKQPDVGKEPPKGEIAKPEEAKAEREQPKAEPSGGDERTTGGARAVSKHGTVKTRSVGPVEKPVTPKPAGKPVRDAARPNPFGDNVKTVSQDQISAVVRGKDNQAALKACYERALKMDNHLTSGRMDVTVSIAASGAVQRVVVNAPASFIMVEPCIKTAIRRWTFPASSEEYGTNFPLIMQGGM